MYSKVKSHKTSSTGGNLDWASVNWADVSDHVWSDGRFWTLGVLTIDDSPWDISMRWVQGFSFLSHFYFILNSFSWCCTLVNLVPVQSISLRASLSTGNPIVCIFFQTDDEWKGLGIKIVFLDGTCFDQVTLAFSFSMLASESPAGSVLYSFGITIWIKVEVTNLPEILN